MRKSTIREVTWDEVRLQVKKLAPDLFEIIEALSPDPSYKLFEAAYPYGEMIVGDEGSFRVPDQNGNLIPINHRDCDKKIQEQFDYFSPAIPFGLVLEGSMHLFVEDNGLHDWISSANVFEPGNLCAMNRFIDNPKLLQPLLFWRITAGVRTPYMIPNISDQVRFEHLKKEFRLKTPAPDSQQEHWFLFRELANHPDFSQKWHTKILFFGKKWIARKDPLLQPLRLAVFERLRDQTELERNKFTYDKIWERTVAGMNNKKLDRYVIAMARHIIESSTGKRISYQIASCEESGPFDEIAKIIREIYGLKKYAPVIVVPKFFDISKNEHAYVSIKLPSIDILRERARYDSLLSDFRKIIEVIKRFKTENTTGPLRGSSAYDIDRYIYQFYSTDADHDEDILPAVRIFDEDSLVKHWKSKGNDQIAIHNAFLRACVKISKKK